MVDMVVIKHSSNIKAVGYDRETREMHVTFHSGATYVYEDVPPDTHAELMDAPSTGGYLNQVVVRQYKTRRL